METINTKTILSSTRKDSHWFGFDYNMNLYRGCCHGCIYCDSRSECYHIENFDTVRAKEDALTILEKELNSRRRKGVIGIGAMSDSYNPFEKNCKLTRGALELVKDYGFGVGIPTKSDLVVRDIDLLQSIGKYAPTFVKFTITAIDDEICKKIEPNVPVTSKRLKAVKELSDAGILTGFLMMPILPFITDNKENILGIVRAAKENGAKFIYPSFSVTLRQNQRTYYYNQLDQMNPFLKEQYIKHFGNSYVCASLKSKELKIAFKNECEKLGIIYRMDDIINLIRKDYKYEQLTLF